MTSLSIVIPAYNEDHGIEAIARRVLATQPKLTSIGIKTLELIIVDDGSSDRTAEIAGSILGVKLIRHHPNQGYGAALKTGFSQASGDLIGFIDADGTYPPEFFPQLCQLAIEGHELVIGSRMSGAKSQMPLMRRLGNILFAGLLSLFSHHRVTDCASGMRVFHREILSRIYPLPDGLNLTPVMSTRAIHEGIKVKEFPIPYSERVGHSKLSVIRDGSIFLQSMVWTVLTYNPVRILGLIGVGGVGFTALVALGLLIARLMGITSLSPWGVAVLFGAMVSAILGINLIALGITFNYLVALFYKQPIRQGLFSKPIFKHPLDRHFGWMGVVSMLLGTLIGVISLALGITGWEISRIWLYLLGAALLFLVGVQLIIYWILVRVLEELSQRELRTHRDLRQEVSPFNE